MKQINSKSALAVALSRLKGYTDPRVNLEQYKTDPEIGADLLWTAYMQGDLKGKKIGDFGAGTGILGIGALLLGSREVIFVESERSALEIAKENLETVQATYEIKGAARFIEGRVEDFEESVDTIVQNPPFGTKIKHADKSFLEKAMKSARVIYSLHKTTSRGFIDALSRDYGFSAVEVQAYTYPLPATLDFHTKKRAYIEVSLFRLTK